MAKDQKNSCGLCAGFGMEKLRKICSGFSTGGDLIAALGREEDGNPGVGERLSAPLVAILTEAAGVS